MDHIKTAAVCRIQNSNKESQTTENSTVEDAVEAAGYAAAWGEYAGRY